MKSDTQFFIDEVMDKLDFCFVDSREYNGAQQFLLDEIDDYDGPSIVVSFKASGDGMVRIDVFTEEKSSKEKLILMEDNLDIEQAVANINEMIREVMVKEEEPEESSEEPVDYNEKLDFDSIYNTEEPVEDNPQVLVKAYLDHDDSVLLVINEEHDELGDLVCYSHVGQHSSCDPYYPDELEELSPKDPRVKELVEEYKNLGPEEIEVFALPVGELLPVQKPYHKEIRSND
jgi:hypothetical protein